MAFVAKLTSKNQLTLPQRIVEQLNRPTHFEGVVAQGALCLWPGRVVSLERQGERAGIPASVLREAWRIVLEREDHHALLKTRARKEMAALDAEAAARAAKRRQTTGS
jgi:hypothetical protein